jgi:(1->4)-alpha-D-glucan 1-alpha-D-glucosylmutase
MIPRATLRLQFHKDFTFAAAERHVSYIASLGISHVYASPITTARAGSLHGYDVIDPTAVNPELGGEQGLRRFVAALRDAGLGGSSWTSFPTTWRRTWPIRGGLTS